MPRAGAMPCRLETTAARDRRMGLVARGNGAAARMGMSRLVPGTNPFFERPSCGRARIPSTCQSSTLGLRFVSGTAVPGARHRRANVTASMSSRHVDAAREVPPPRSRSAVYLRAALRVGDAEAIITWDRPRSPPAPSSYRENQWELAGGEVPGGRGERGPAECRST